MLVYQRVNHIDGIPHDSDFPTRPRETDDPWLENPDRFSKISPGVSQVILSSATLMARNATYKML